MTVETLQFWETALDITGLLMCVLTLGYLVRIRLAGRRVQPQPAATDFKKEMQAQTRTVGQGADNDALATIARALDRERRNLQQVLGAGLEPAYAAVNSPDAGFPQMPDPKAPVYRAFPPARRKSGVYSEAVELSECGLSTRQIADKVRLPRGEVELSIKLRKRRQRK